MNLNASAIIVGLGLAASANAAYTGLAIETYVGAEWVAQGYTGLTTYRLYAEFDDPTDVLIAVNGSSLGAMEMHSDSGTFFNDTSILSGGLKPGPGGIPGFFSVAWDSWFALDYDTPGGGAMQLSPGFATEVGGLAGDFSTTNAAWFVTPADAPQGEADGGRVLIAQLTVGAGEDVWGTINLQDGDAVGYLGEEFTTVPAPGALALLGLAGLAGGRRRRA
jgi:MYXO-CTERM domain-containing protein